MEYEHNSQSHSGHGPVMIEDMKALLEEAAERGARAAIRWMRNRESKNKEDWDGPEERHDQAKMEALVGSSRAPRSGKTPKPKEEDHRWEELRKEISDLKRHLEPRTMNHRRGSPFTREILSASLPLMFDSHSSRVMEEIKGIPVITTTLVGRAQTWFLLLPPGSVQSFEQLIRDFIQHFASNKRYPKNPGHLFAIIQEEGESLRSYVQRFANEILDIPDISPGFLSGIMAQGLRNGGLADSLIGEPAPNWDELLSRAKKFILIEESRKVRSSNRPRKEPDRGHTTEECVHLKEELERLLQMGHFGELTQSTKDDLPSKRMEVRFGEYSGNSRKHQNPSGKIINMIE
ncbi:UNVERIFIED_CONTAM: hypothetical protein Slati_1379200 [Sesamum latifolium]|uniref:Retrotransposon gag domain-containing protein n=1 Tax=Sesamum latifolium TaxID=2727402 RepID=A0AAW2X2Y8_9LAMI